MASQGTSIPPEVGVSGAHPSEFNVASSETSLSEVLITLRKRRLVVIAAGLLGLIYGLYRVTLQPNMYEATGRIEVRTGSSNEYRVNAVYSFSNEIGTRLQSEVNILQSEALMLSVAKDLDLANRPYFFGAKSGVQRLSLDDPRVRQAAIGTLQGHLKVGLVLKTDIIRIGYTSLDAQLSADIVNKVIAEYIQRSYETRYRASQRVSQWLSGELDDLKKQVDLSETQMLDAQRRIGIVGLDPTHSQMVAGLDDLTRATAEARVARVLAEARYRTLSGMGKSVVDPAAAAGVQPGMAGGLQAASNPDSSTVGGVSSGSEGTGGVGALGVAAASGVNPGNPPSGLSNQLATLQASYAQVQATLGPNHPTVKAVRAQVEELQRQIALEQQRMLAATKESYLIARNTENQTTSMLDTEKNNAYKLRDDFVEYTQRQREYESNRTLYETLRQRLRVANVQAGLESVEIDIVDPALPPASPVLQGKTSTVVIALLFSLVAGAGLAFLLESLDTGLRSIAEIESITQLPSLAIIPRARKTSTDSLPHLTTAQRNISVLTQPKSQFAEAIRSLRTSLLLSTAGRPPRFILLTSATPAEGKTTTASNLACVLAQGDSNVLLIDADLRRPNVHHRFGLNGKVGVTSLLTGSMRLEDAVQRIPEVPNLDVLPSGPIPPFPTEMLDSQAMDHLLAECAKRYTHVVIDSPPVLSVTDGILLARKVQAVALVIRHGKSSKHVVRRARDLLLRAGAPITGIVLNAVDLNAPEYYGYYGYSGYSYSSIDADSWEATAEAGSRNGRSGR